MKKSELLELTDSEFNKKVKVAGTNWDRRRKLTNKDIYEIKRMYSRIKSVSDIAERFNVCNSTVKYHLFEDYKAYKNRDRLNYVNNSNSGSYKELASYKRKLLNENKRLIVDD